MTGRFMQYYRENAKYKERTYTFVERVGIERIRAVVVDDSEGIADELDRRDAGVGRGRLRSLEGGDGAEDREPVRVAHPGGGCVT